MQLGDGPRPAEVEAKQRQGASLSEELAVKSVILSKKACGG